MVTTQKLSLHPYISNNLVTTSAKHAKSTLIEQINNTINIDIDTIKTKLKRREDFWMLKLDALTRKRLNQELNNVPICCIFYVHFRLSSTNYCNEERNSLQFIGFIIYIVYRI